ncbi:ATP-binding protein [Streptomyces sp. WI04-05B]|uniref:ATP-binding protein n=1 Tax=Streptomyces TaxID=1883 RepID=UPI0029A69002|nr:MULTISPECIES: ATP-binding protein [unclassified Streptomyces]MDX2544683.1 ATP-binding protein [Streptomyces sp. WI04-05B]MDX2588791.1 ATP-binding protein [Streptomyces sp. WI04-05A]
MGQQKHRRDDLLVSSNFIRAIRESGYVSLSTALAELIDNSLQAAATEVAITIVRTKAGEDPEIRVEDNGEGMSRSEIETCLRFGGSSRFDERRSFGRFGLGLPAASLSQARQIEVTSWQNGRVANQVCLDVDAVATGVPADLRARRQPGSTVGSGCRVIWRNCDRIEYRRLAWLERAVRRDLGRLYRRFLSSGKLDLTINGKRVDPVDPMLLTAKVEGHSARLAFEPLRYELVASSGETAFVTVRFALLPVHHWHHLDNVTKRRTGIVGGAGVSVLRAGREIASGWHLMGAKRKENYDDWWRCEIDFDPVLDEHFGITVNKQGIRPSQELQEALGPELESIARLLNSRVRQAFEEVKFQAATETSCRIAEAADVDLPVIRSAGKGSGALSYRIGSEQLPIETMFTSALKRRTLDVTLNVDHPAFAALYRPLQTLGDEPGRELRTALELFVLSFARTTTLLVRDGHNCEDLLRVWSKTYGRMLQKS